MPPINDKVEFAKGKMNEPAIVRNKRLIPFLKDHGFKVSGEIIDDPGLIARSDYRGILTSADGIGEMINENDELFKFCVRRDQDDDQNENHKASER
eukprot:Nk52_evm26s2426 gene=Nk52_evmTU26s2426